MRSLSRPLLSLMALIALWIILAILFHLAGIVWEFSQLLGAAVGGILTLYAALAPMKEDEQVEPWLGRERLGWLLVGCGLLMWAFGESIWRYYILTNQSPFPSYADIGYSSMPPLVFLGLLLQPSSDAGRGRVLTLFDSLIAMGSLLSIAWYLLLGSLALGSNENLAAKILGIYYPTSDVALLSCVILLLLRGQGRLYQSTARRNALFIIALGLCCFATSDFIFNIQQNANTYVEGTWVDIGWPIGLMTIAIGAYLRRFLPLTSDDAIEQRLNANVNRMGLGVVQYITYGLVGILLVVLGFNVFAHDAVARAIRPVLFIATVLVIGLVIARQVLTIIENERLAQRQKDALNRLEVASQRIEEQAAQAARRNNDLEVGITHLKDVQARLANGNLRARARLNEGELMPLAASLNLMAERLARLEQTDLHAQRMRQAVEELCVAIERARAGKPFIVPLSCNEFPELSRLLFTIGIRPNVETVRPTSPHSPPAAFSTQTQQTSRQMPSPFSPPATPMTSNRPLAEQEPPRVGPEPGVRTPRSVPFSSPYRDPQRGTRE